MRRMLLATSVLALFLLHQDIWFWRTPDPLLFGFLPIALSYHALFSVAAALLMWALVKYSWPSHLDMPEAAQAHGRRDAAANSNTIEDALETGGPINKEDRT